MREGRAGVTGKQESRAKKERTLPKIQPVEPTKRHATGQGQLERWIGESRGRRYLTAAC